MVHRTRSLTISPVEQILGDCFGHSHIVYMAMHREVPSVKSLIEWSEFERPKEAGRK